MRSSEHTGKLIAALSQAQGEFPPVIKDRTAKVPTKSGSSYEYHYADLATIMATVAPVLSKHGLAIVQAPTVEGDMWLLLTRLAHGDEWIESEYPLPRGLTAQETGSALTYARRYCVQAVLGIASETDDDGAAASKPANGRPPVRTLDEPMRATTARTVAVEKEAKRAALPPTSDRPISLGIVERVEVRSDIGKNGKPYTRYAVQIASDEHDTHWYSTFSQTVGDMAKSCLHQQIEFTWKDGGLGKNGKPLRDLVEILGVVFDAPDLVDVSDAREED